MKKEGNLKLTVPHLIKLLQKKIQETWIKEGKKLDKEYQVAIITGSGSFIGRVEIKCLIIDHL